MTLGDKLLFDSLFMYCNRLSADINKEYMLFDDNVLENRCKILSVYERQSIHILIYCNGRSVGIPLDSKRCRFPPRCAYFIGVGVEGLA